MVVNSIHSAAVKGDLPVAPLVSGMTIFILASPPTGLAPNGF